MRGRKPVPTVLHEIHGNPSKLPPKLAEPKPVGDLTAAPAFLTENQREEWRYILRHAPPGLLKLLDRRALAAWVVASDLHEQATIAQSKVGLLIKAPSGHPIQSPYLPIINKQALILIKLASELGFTPASRPRIFAAPAPGEGFHGGNTDDKAPAASDSYAQWLADDPDEATIQ